jgi:8-oxo-dGTP pyrophosphatase MutT (NUDIX family)
MVMAHERVTDPGEQQHSGGVPEVGRLRARYVRRVTAEHVRQRVSIRHLADDPGRGPRPTDVVGRLLALDDDTVVIVDRQGRLHVIDARTVIASRVIPPHPRLPAEPDVGTQDQPVLRRAARVLLLDRDDRVLLVSHAPTNDRRVWTAPGGGLEPDEDPLEGARRELREEIGIEPPIGPWVWRRRVVFAFRSVWIDQDERWFLARVDRPTDVSDAPLGDAGAVEARWWTLEQLRLTDQALAPAALPVHLQRLLDHGVPQVPVDVGT